MTTAGPLLQFALLAGFVLAVTLALLIALVERPLQRLARRLAPRHRARLLWWLLLAPAVCGAAYAALTVAMPSVLQGSSHFAMACAAHGGSWWHACLWHPGAHDGSPALWLAITLLCGYVVWLALRGLSALWRARQFARMLLGIGRASGGADRIVVLEVEQPLALACGVGRGHVVLSQALIDRLAPMQVQVVLAHERDHVRHRDVFWRLLAQMLSGLHMTGVRQRLMASLDLAVEQGCDRAAAGAVGSRLAVAETILAVERIVGGHPHPHPGPALAAAFGRDFVRERVYALLSPDRDARLFLGSFLTLALMAFCALSAGWLHHLTEALVAVLAG